MQILLINPPRQIPQKADFPPLGLAYLASSLKAAGIQVGLIDASQFTWKELERRIKEKSPKIAGIPCWTLERGQAYKTATLVKKIFPETRIIIGGHHATAFPAHMFRLANADAVVLGEGEATICELAKALLNNGDLREIKGIAFKIKSEIIINERRDLISDLDSIPFPSYDGINPADYLGLPEARGRSSAIITSRGCTHKCLFCSSSKFWKVWRPRSSSNVLDEIEWLKKQHNINSLMFFDDNFTVNKKRAIEICQGIISRNLKISWAACSHVNHPDTELLKWMKRAGCYRIDYGVESGSDAVLQSIKKQQTTDRIEKTFVMTHEAGILPRAYLMVGNPGESRKSIEDTISLVKRIKPYNTTSGQLLWILPDTDICQIAKDKGIINDDTWLESDSMIYFTAEKTLRELKSLRRLLMKGIAMNNGKVFPWLEYIIRVAYYRFSFLQKFREWRSKYAHLTD